MEKEKQKWLYSLNQSDDIEDAIDIFDNAGEIKMRRFVFSKDEHYFYEETIHVKGGDLFELIHNYFEEKKKEIHEV